jgi:hypothetical protein
MADHYYLVLPALPTDGLQLIPAYSSGFAYQSQLNMYGPGPLPHLPPYVFYGKAADAHKKAAALASEHKIPYHVAQVNIMGQYAPPPPEWKPTYTETWTKP